MLHAGFERILKPLDEQYRGKTNQMKTEQKSKAPHIEKTHTHVSSGWYVHSNFPHGDICDLLRMYCSKDCE